MSELKPCPFCGSEQPQDSKDDGNVPYEFGMSRICNSCSAAVNHGWNARPIEDALNARIAELEAAQRWIPVGWDALKVALFWMNVEKTEYCWIWTGSKNSCGYGTLHGARAHQISYKMFHGDLPEGLEIMHTCNNPACVNPGHLLAGTHQENMQSMFKLRRYSRCGKSSKYIGVSFRSDSHKWRAVLNKKSLGNYESEDDAAKAYDKAALVHYGKDAALNFPLPQPPEVQE